MGSTKIVVLVLVLVVVIFVVFVIYGVGKNRSRIASDNPKQDAKKFKEDPPPELEKLKKLDSLFGISGPKLKFRQMKPSRRDFDLLSQPQHEIEVSRDDDHKFRKATFRITQGQPGCAIIKYKAEGNVDKNLKEQNWPNGDVVRDKVTFWILKTGGRITFSRSNPTFSAPCTVQLE